MASESQKQLQSNYTVYVSYTRDERDTIANGWMIVHIGSDEYEF